MPDAGLGTAFTFFWQNEIAVHAPITNCMMRARSRPCALCAWSPTPRATQQSQLTLFDSNHNMHTSGAVSVVAPC